VNGAWNDLLVGLLVLVAFVAVGALMAVNAAWSTCKIAGHDWGLPWNDNGRRKHRCERCFRVRDYVYEPLDFGAGLNQAAIDGGLGIPKVRLGPGPARESCECRTCGKPIRRDIDIERPGAALELRDQWCACATGVLAEDDERAIERARVAAVVRQQWGRGTDSQGVN
jgi:hypothetical protein